MSFTVRQAWPTDLERIVALAVECQQDPNRACGYFSAEPAALQTELEEIAGEDDWTTVTWVALDDERDLVGWLAAESDVAMSRIWWRGPFLADPSSPLVDAIADGLFSAGTHTLAGFRQHELAIDIRSLLLARFAERHGFTADEGSVVLRAASLAVEFPVSGAVIEVAGPSEPEAAALHNVVFAGTHSTGEQLFESAGERRDRFVARVGTEVVGYVATEVQHDGSLYIDYVGVAGHVRSQGIGRALVAMAMRARAGEATHANLTVRVSNTAARQLYSSLGFVEDLVLVPYRRGFSIA